MRAEFIAGDFFDPYGRDYRPERVLRDLAEWGVTAINTKLTDTNVFDGVSSVVKIHAPTTYEDHFVKYRAALRINLGEPPRSEERKFPTTRMGIVGMVRENFIKAEAYRKKWKEWEEAENGDDQDNGKVSAGQRLQDGASDSGARERDSGDDACRRAHGYRDGNSDRRRVRSAAHPFSFVHDPRGASAGASGTGNIPVILGTYYAHINNHICEQTEFRYETAAMLAERGVPIAFGGLKGETKLLLRECRNRGPKRHALPKGARSADHQPGSDAGRRGPDRKLGGGQRRGHRLCTGVTPWRSLHLWKRSSSAVDWSTSKVPFDPTYHNMEH